jgi:hypothetical protein
VRRWFLISATGFKYVESSKDKTLKLMCLFVDNQLDSSDVWRAIRLVNDWHIVEVYTIGVCLVKTINPCSSLVHVLKDFTRVRFGTTLNIISSNQRCLFYLHSELVVEVNVSVSLHKLHYTRVKLSSYISYLISLLFTYVTLIMLFCVKRFSLFLTYVSLKDNVVKNLEEQRSSDFPSSSKIF